MNLYPLGNLQHTHPQWRASGVLREFPFDITTGRMTEGNPPLQRDDWDIFNGPLLLIFKEDGPNSALCKYYNTVSLGFRVPSGPNS